MSFSSIALVMNKTRHSVFGPLDLSRSARSLWLQSFAQWHVRLVSNKVLYQFSSPFTSLFYYCRCGHVDI